MGWVRVRDLEEFKHECKLPDVDSGGISHDDLWRDNECGKLWRVGLACARCNMYGRTSGTCGSHMTGLSWRPATIWQRIRYWKWT